MKLFWNSPIIPPEWHHQRQMKFSTGSNMTILQVHLSEDNALEANMVFTEECIYIEQTSFAESYFSSLALMCVNVLQDDSQS